MNEFIERSRAHNKGNTPNENTALPSRQKKRGERNNARRA